MWEWLDKRLYIRTLLLNPIVPRGRVSWQYLPVIFTFALLIFQIITGMWLAFYFVPGQISYDEILSNNLFRYLYNCHYLGAQALIVCVVLFILRNLLTGTYRSPREIHWLTAVFLVFLICLNYCIGALLPPTKAARSTMQVFKDLLVKFPLVGTWFVDMLGLSSSSSFSHHQLFVWHSVVLPMLIYCVIFFYMWLVMKGDMAPATEKIRSS